MKNLYKAIITIEDKGQIFTVTEEIISESIITIRKDLIKQLNKYRHAMGISKNYKIKKYDAQHIGWA